MLRVGVVERGRRPPGRRGQVPHRPGHEHRLRRDGRPLLRLADPGRRPGYFRYRLRAAVSGGGGSSAATTPRTTSTVAYATAAAPTRAAAPGCHPSCGQAASGASATRTARIIRTCGSGACAARRSSSKSRGVHRATMATGRPSTSTPTPAAGSTRELSVERRGSRWRCFWGV